MSNPATVLPLRPESSPNRRDLLKAAGTITAFAGTLAITGEISALLPARQTEEAPAQTPFRLSL